MAQSHPPLGRLAQFCEGYKQVIRNQVAAMTKRRRESTSDI